MAKILAARMPTTDNLRRNGLWRVACRLTTQPVIVRFHTYEEASIYAGVMQADGHFAAILDESMGFIYGPLAIGGFRVIVTEEPAVETEEPPENGKIEGAILDFLRLLLGAFVALGLAVGIGIEWKAAGESFVPGLLVLAAAAAGWLGICLSLGPLMTPFTRKLRDDSSVSGWLAKGLVALIFAGQWIVMPFLILHLLWTLLVH